MKKLVSVMFLIFAFWDLNAKFMYGIDVLENNKFDIIRNKKVGLLINSGARNSKGNSTLDIFLNAKEVKLGAVFLTEHGENDITKSDLEKKNIKVFCTHEPNRRRPDPEWLQGLDAVVVDLQGVGIRYYTFYSSMLHMMAVCFQQGVELIILDRPNPLGSYVGGPCMEKEYLSFLGLIEGFPMYHGMTIGEVANYVKNRGQDLRYTCHCGMPNCKHSLDISSSQLKKGKLSIVKMREWNHHKLLTQCTNLTPKSVINWSPAIQEVSSIFRYAVIFSITSIGDNSIGLLKFFQDTDSSPSERFKYFYSDKISAPEIIARLQKISPSPISGCKLGVKKIGEKNYVELEVTNFKLTTPAFLSLALISIAQDHATPEEWKKLTPLQKELIGKHIGENEFFQTLISGAKININHFYNKWKRQASEFRKKNKKYYLYN